MLLREPLHIKTRKYMCKINYLFPLYLTFLLSILLTQGCSESELPSGPRGIGFKLTNSFEHQRVLSQMKESDIPYVETEQGMVNYLLKNHAAVSGIKRRAMTWSSFLVQPS